MTRLWVVVSDGSHIIGRFPPQKLLHFRCFSFISLKKKQKQQKKLTPKSRKLNQNNDSQSRVSNPSPSPRFPLPFFLSFSLHPNTIPEKLPLRFHFPPKQGKKSGSVCLFGWLVGCLTDLHAPNFPRNIGR